MKEKEISSQSEKAKDLPRYGMWQNVGYMIALAWQNSKSILFFCLAASAASVLSSVTGLLVVPAVLRQVETAAPFSGLLCTIFGFTAALMLLSAIKSYVNANAIYGRVPLRSLLVDRIHQKFCTTSYPNTEDPIVLRRLDEARSATNSNEKATEAIWDTLTGLLQNLTGFALYLALLASLPPSLLFIVPATSVAGYLAGRRIREWEFRHRDELTACNTKLFYFYGLSQNRSLAKDIRIFHMRPWLDSLYESTLRLWQSLIARRERVFLLIPVLELTMTFLRNGISYACLIRLALDGRLSASEFLLYFTAVGEFTGWINGILENLSTLHRQSLEISLVREFLEMPESFAFQEGKPLTPPADGRLELRFCHVSFCYPGAEKDTLHDLNLTIRPGEKLALVGLNGAGKTTFVKLLCGFYDPTKGQILLNGEDIRQYNRQDYYRLFCAVFQQFSLLEATLAQNVAQTTKEAGIDSQKVTACIEKAGLVQKTESLPSGLETHLGRQVHEDGVELSGGEIQRLMLARALYKDGAILVLDEPTAALDPLAENDIYRKYNAIAAGRTSVYISHRLASTRFCDRILFLEQGQIREEGTHDSLMAANGKYAALFHVQSKYYQEGASSHEA